MGSVRADLVQPAAPVLVVLVVMVAGSVGGPRALAINRLRARLRRALVVVVNEGASKAVVSRCHADLVQPALPVLVVLALMLARSVGSPRSHAVHGLSAAALSPLLVHMGIWAVVSIVGRVHGDLVVAVPLVLVLDVLKVKGRKGTDRSKRTIHSTDGQNGGIRRAHVLARAVGVPRTHAIHGLRASTSRALLVVVRKRTSIPIMRSIHANQVVPTPPVLVVLVIVITRSIGSPGTSTINRLGASSRGLLLVVVSQRTSLTVVGREHAVLIEAMPEVLVLGIVIVAARVGVPSTHTIDRLGALVLRALHLAIGVGASIASKVGLRRDLV